MPQQPAVVAGRHAQAGVAVVVGRAAGRPVAARLLRAGQLGEQKFQEHHRSPPFTVFDSRVRQVASGMMALTSLGRPVGMSGECVTRPDRPH